MASTVIPSVNMDEMPFSLEAEQSVIGCALVYPETITTILSNVLPEYFYMPMHRDIMSEILRLDMLGSHVDAVIVLDKLKSGYDYDPETTKKYLIDLAQMMPTSANVEGHCKIVREKFYLRSLIAISRDTIDDATKGEADPDKILDAAEQRIYDIRKGKTNGHLQQVGDVIGNAVFPMLSNLNSENADDYKGIPTGFSALDELTSGLNKSDLILIGARPSMGKSALALNMARNVAYQSNKKVVFFSLEMSNEQLAGRLLATEARVASNKLRNGDLSSDEWKRLAEAADQLCRIPLYFDDSTALTVPELKSKIKREGRVDCVFIDYIGLMQSSTKKENRVQEVSEISRGLKMLAKELNIPVVCCCQLSRGPEKNGKSTNSRPFLSDLRDSGSLEQDADIVLLIYRQEYYDSRKNGGDGASDDNLDMNIAEINVAKNRHGPTDKVNLHYEKEFTLFATLEYRDADI